MSSIQITRDQDGVGRVVVDGRDLADAVEYPVVIGRDFVSLHLPDAVFAEVEGRVALDDATTKALRALGWTPPAEGVE